LKGKLMKKQNALATGTTCAGFTVQETTPLPEYQSEGILCLHEKTGCRLYHIANDDPENAFAFVFRTPPKNSTGVAHILEHSVLCGSKNFPLKDPFNLLLKGSMHTYLNAWTYPDKTVYPASSVNKKDYFNILRVYADAVFFPLLRKETFLQEAHHFEFTNAADESGPLTVTGVVYNEMKGNYSSQSSIVGEWTLRSLFPDTPYGVDSGGDPGEIIGLTHQELVAFHHSYYHPSNCRILLYGNIPLREQLEFLDTNFLSRFEKLKHNSALPLQKRTRVPIRLEKSYPVQSGESLAKKTEVTLNWLLAPVTDSPARTALTVLEEILAGNAGSPLRRALVESGLGEDYSSAAGLETEIREMVFSTGLRGTEARDADKIEALCRSVLGELVKNGIPHPLIEASLHRMEFRSREISGAQTPYGLRLFQRSLRGWLHDAPPQDSLLVISHLEELKKRLKNEPRLLETLIEKYILDNNHRSTVIVAPDPEYMNKFESKLTGEIRKAEATLDVEKRKALKNELKELHDFQAADNRPEDEKKIPFLLRGDLPSRVEKIKSSADTLKNGIPISFVPMFTNGIVYVDFAFRVDTMPSHHLPYLPFFARALTGCGLPGQGYAEIQQELSLLTGGFGGHIDAGKKMGAQDSPGYLFFRVKMLEPKTAAALELVAGLFAKADFTDSARLRDILLESKNSLASSIIPRGSFCAMLRAGRYFSRAIALQEMWEGVSQAVFLAGEAANLAAGKNDLRAVLENIRSELFSSTPLAVSLTCAKSSYGKAKIALEKTIGQLFSQRRSGTATVTSDPGQYPAHEALLFPTSVGFVARVFPSADYGSRDYVAQNVLGHYLDTGILHEKVRTLGGAYGAMAMPFRQEGVFVFGSYRDPHIVKTLAAFEESLQSAARNVINGDDLEKAIIGTVAREETPLRPNEKGFVHFRRSLFGIDDAIRQKQRDCVLALSAADIRDNAEKLLSQFGNGSTAVITGQDALERAKKENPSLRFEETEILL
jgi:Zn-dependent M16 (insulinase) family peptidase